MTEDVGIAEVLRKRTFLIAIAVALVAVLAWTFAFFMPQSKKLSTLRSEQASLQATINKDDARVRLLRTETQHVGQIESTYTRLQGYVPKTEELYTYIQTLSGAAKSAGVKITSIQPGPLEAVTGTSYSAAPITASVKGTYDQMLAFIRDIYALPRLTDVNDLSISDGGPGTNRSTTLSASFDLAIFTSQHPETPGQ